MISRRHQISSQVVSVSAPILIVFLALAMGLLAVLLAGKSPVDAVEAIYKGAFGNTRSISSTISRMVPMCLVALGWIIAFSTKRVSIGFEGQIIAGGAAAAYVGLTLNGLSAFVHLPLALIAAVLAGAFWVALPTFMWARRGVHEIITTLLMNLIALELAGPWPASGSIGNLCADRPHFSKFNLAHHHRWDPFALGRVNGAGPNCNRRLRVEKDDLWSGS
jgi:ABC-type uncharacterized transport system permease subunit